MKNKFLIFCSMLLIVACSESPDSSDQGLSNDRSSSPKYSAEELLGKTIEEYELFEKERAKEAAEDTTDQISSQPSELTNNGFLELAWEDLVAPGYDADSIMEKYNPLIDQLEHGSDDALKLYQKMEDEFNNAPANAQLADKKVSIPGFIAPLEQLNGMITEFLLVPYFGACIHMPPPPSNQTLYIKVAADYAIRNEDSYEPIWVSGKLSVSDTSTELGSASYQIQDALISKYQ
ncbi:MAG: DUF3299 domain-containing protein [Arenicella sp.]